MTVQTTPWMAARNLVASSQGSIHDDAQARQLGFPGGLVGGNVQVAIVTMPIVETLGPAYYERGFLRHTWVKPVYDSEEVQAVVREREGLPCDERLVDFELRKRDGTVAAAGFAGIATSLDEAVPPWLRQDAQPPAPTSDHDPLPEAIGEAYAPRDVDYTPQRATRSLAGYDPNPWYTQRSPWDGPIVPTVSQLVLTGYGRPDSPKGMRAGINASTDILQTGPVFVGRTYRREAHLADKGVQGRYAFRTIELRLLDGDERRVAWLRWKIKWVHQPPDDTTGGTE